MQHIFGLDIADRSAELVALEKKGTRVRLVRRARREIPPGAIDRGVIIEPDRVEQTLAGLFDEAFGAKRGKLSAGISLPETVVFSKLLSLPPALSADHSAKAAALEAADSLPIPPARALTACVPVARNAKAQHVLYMAVEREVAKGYEELLGRLGVEPLFFDAEPMALIRALVGEEVQDPVLIVDIGARTTNMSICDRGMLLMSGTVMLGGDALTAAIEKKLKLPLSEAEALRRKDGFDPTLDNGRLILVMEKPMNELIGEIRRTIRFYEQRYGRKIKTIVLAGGTSLTPQLAEYVGSNIPDTSVVRGNPLGAISLDGVPDAEALARDSVLWATSVGLALRAIGARASPGVDFLKAGRQPRSIWSLFTNSIAMATRAKKTTPKKKSAAAGSSSAADASAFSQPERPLPPPVRMQIDAAPASAASAGPAKAASDDRDFGHAIGDILSEVDEVKPSSVRSSSFRGAAEEEEEDDGLHSRKSIESILQRGDSGDDDDGGRRFTGPTGYAAKSGRSPLPLIILAVACVVVAGAGIFMFVRKNGAPMLPASIGRLFGGTQQTATPPAQETAKAPETVNTVVLLSTAAVPEEKRPVLLTRVIETDVKATDKFPATGISTSEGGKAVGKITITNETEQAFQFVARTRLLSKDGVLFRMTAGSAIPAKGSVIVDVASDEPGAVGDIAATTFTIPGLSPALQKEVYGKSDAAMTGGAGKAVGVSEDDIAAAKTALAEKLKAEATANFEALLAEGESRQTDLVTASEISYEGPKSGDAGAEFTVTLSLRFRALLVPEKEVMPLLDAALSAAAAGSTNGGTYTLGTPLYTVQAYDTAAEKAELRIEAPITKE